MVNKVILIGNVGRDPEVRNTQGGQEVATFTIATTRRWKDKGGNRQEQTEWHNVVFWGKLAEIAGKYVTKGRQIYVEGRLQTRSWDDKNSGEKKYRTEIVCETLQLLGRNPDAKDDDRGRGGAGGRGRGGDSDGGGYDRGYGDSVDDDDDIPF